MCRQFHDDAFHEDLFLVKDPTALSKRVSRRIKNGLVRSKVSNYINKGGELQSRGDRRVVVLTGENFEGSQSECSVGNLSEQSRLQAARMERKFGYGFRISDILRMLNSGAVSAHILNNRSLQWIKMARLGAYQRNFFSIRD